MSVAISNGFLRKTTLVFGEVIKGVCPYLKAWAGSPDTVAGSRDDSSLVCMAGANQAIPKVSALMHLCHLPVSSLHFCPRSIHSAYVLMRVVELGPVVPPKLPPISAQYHPTSLIMQKFLRTISIPSSLHRKWYDLPRINIFYSPVSISLSSHSPSSRGVRAAVFFPLPLPLHAWPGNTFPIPSSNIEVVLTLPRHLVYKFMSL